MQSRRIVWQELDDDLRSSHKSLLETLVEDREAFGAECASATLKENRLRTVFLVEPGRRSGHEGATPSAQNVDTPKWVVKCYRHLRLVDRWRHAVTRSSAEREYTILRRLHEGGFPVPRPLGFGLRYSAGAVVEGVLIMEEIPDARNFHDYVLTLLSSGQITELRALLMQMGQIIRRLHDRGVWHPDLHSGNFLIQGEPPGRVYLIDLHSCRFVGYMPGLLRRRGFAQMAYLRQFMEAGDFRWLLASYLYAPSGDIAPAEALRARGFPTGRAITTDDEMIPRREMAEILAFERLVCRFFDRHQKRRLRSRTRRCVLRSTVFTVESRQGYKWYRRREASRDELSAFVSSRSPADVIKYDSASWVSHVRTAEGPAIVKYRRYGWRQRIASLFVSHRLRRAWIAAHGFDVRNLPTPRALALVEKRFLFLVKEAWLIVEECTETQPLDSFLWHSHKHQNPALGARERHALSRHLGGLLRQLHEAGVRAHDLSPQNLLVRSDLLPELSKGALRTENQGVSVAPVAFIDLDDTRFVSRVDRRRRLRNLVQVGNLPEGHVSLPDRLRVLRSYDGGSGEYYVRTTIRELREALLAEAFRTINRMTRLEYVGLMETIPE